MAPKNDLPVECYPEDKKGGQMNHKLLKPIVLPLQDKILGRDTTPYLKGLDRVLSFEGFQILSRNDQ